jgi:fucose 4-O-acetylase-like acetyltransferase
MHYIIEDNLDRQAELDNCDFVKTILMILVVVYHSIVFWGGNWFTRNPASQSVILGTVAEWLNSFHIYAFVFVSGYLFCCLKYEKGKYQKFSSFVSNKTKRLLVPYAFVAVIWVIPIQWLFFRDSAVDIIEKFALGISPNQLWFLIMLFVVFVVCWLLSDFFVKYHLIGAFVAILLYGIGLIGPRFIPNVFMIWRALTYIPFFWLGFKIRQKGLGFFAKIPAIGWLVLDCAVFAVVKVISPDASVLTKLLTYGLEFLLHVVGALMAFVVLQSVAKRIKPNGAVMTFLSKRSMVIYLFHQQVIYIPIFLLNGIISHYLLVLISFVFAMLVPLLIYEILIRFKTTKFLLGEK